MSRTFVSYASPDHELVQREVIDLLEELGIATWFAPEAVRSADLWKKSIQRGLARCEWFVVVVSAHAAASKWVRREVRWALKHRPERIVPFVIDKTKTAAVDPRLTHIQHLDYAGDRTGAVHRLAGLLVRATFRGFRRGLDGRWLCAVQPVYYSLRRRHYAAGRKSGRVATPRAMPAEGDWHVQKVEITPSAGGYLVDTLAGDGKLQWRWDATLEENAFLVGPWKSKRRSSDSRGYMSVQVARNGTYMFGHDYAIVLDEAKAHYGLLLLGQDEECLEKAWSAMKNAQRPLEPLTSRIDFPDR